jgi:hypothetical protein
MEKQGQEGSVEAEETGIVGKECKLLKIEGL